MGFYELYEKICVKVECKGSVGSGVLYQPKSDDYTYVLTAAHCIKGTDKEPQVFNISIKRFEADGSVTDYNVLDYKIHQSADLAVIILEKQCDFESPIIVEKEYKSTVSICGFPKESEEKSNPKEIFDGELIATSRNKLELRMEESIATFYHGDDYYLPGFSGSGIFIETEQHKLAIVGIFTEVKHLKVAYKALVGESLDQVNEVFKDSKYPLLSNPYPSYMMRKITSKYKYLYEWSSNPRLNMATWVDFGRSKDLISEIQAHLMNKDDINVLHIVGRSGIGKTHSILKACQEEENLSTVLYFDSYVSFKDSFCDYVLSSHGSFKLVIDDVSLEEWEKLNIEFSSYYNRIRIVTIGVAPEYKLTSREGIRIVTQPTNDDVIKLIKHTDPSISDEDSKYIADLCEKDLRLLMLLLSANKKDIREIGLMSSVATRFGSLDSLLDRILNQFKHELGDIIAFKKYYSKLCLLVDVGIKGSFREEIKYISNYFALNHNEMDSFIEKANNCWLGIIREEFFEALPRALARLLFEKEGWSLIKHDLNTFINNMPTYQMKKRFINRVEECGDTFREEVKAELSAWFCITFPEFDLKLIDDIEKAKIFKVYTEFSPEWGLNWLKHSVKIASGEELGAFEGYEGFFGRNKSRRYIVWLCEHLACFKEYFWDCEDILFSLAQHETETHITNNSQGIWSGLFVPILSNTEIPFQPRYELLMKRLRNGNDENIELILNAITPIFNDQIFRMVPPKIIGGRVVPQQWHPSSEKELIQLRKWALDTFINSINSLGDPLKIKIIDYIIKELSVFIQFGFMQDLKHLFGGNVVSAMQLRQLKYCLEEYTSRVEKYGYDSTYYHKVKEWESELTVTNLEERLKDYIYRNYWNHFHSTSEMIVDKEISGLAIEIVEKEIKLNEFTTDFESNECDVTSLMKLAEKIAFFDIHEIYSEYVLSLIKENKLIQFVTSFINGIMRRTESLPKWCIDILDEYELIHPRSIVSITISCDVTKRGFSRVLRVIESSQVINYELFQMQFRDWGELLSEDEKVILFKKIVSFVPSNNRMHIILRLNNMWNHGKENLTISDKKALILLDVLGRCLVEEFEFDDWDWNETIKIIPIKYISNICEILALALLDLKRGHSQLENFALSNLIKFAKEGFSEVIMENLGKVMLNPTLSYKFFIHVYRGLFEAIDLDVIKKWVKKHGIEAARTLARHIASPTASNKDSGFVPPLTEWLLSEFEFDERLFREFIAGRHSFEVFSIEAKVDEHEKLVTAMKPYLEHKLKRVREWADYEIRNSENIIKDHEIQKARDQRE